jgi:GMP synthase-like glutamine amidotransferase
MRVLAIVHEADAGPGVFTEVAIAGGHELHEWPIIEQQRCPEDPFAYDAVVSLGGSMHAHQQEEHPWLAEEEALLASLAAAGRPVLGVCLGSQLLAQATGGSTAEMGRPEIGWSSVSLSDAGRADPLLAGLAPSFQALQWHSCEFRPAPDALTLAASPLCAQAYRVGSRAWGIQFHAEVTLADFESWIDYHLAHPSEGNGPADAEALRAAVREGIEAWNELGRGMFSRFLELAAARD